MRSFLFYRIGLVANYYCVRFEPNKDVISIVQYLNETWIPSLGFSHVAAEHSLHPVRIVRLDAGPATKANMLNESGRDIEINNSQRAAWLCRDPTRERVSLMVADNPN